MKFLLLLCYNAYVDHEEDDGYDGNDQNDTEVRKKRQAEQYEYTPTKTRCPLLLVADYRFYQEMGGSNTKTTINYLVRTLFLIIHKYIICIVYICFISCLRIYGFCRTLTESLVCLPWCSFSRVFQLFTALEITSQHSCAVSCVSAFGARL